MLEVWKTHPRYPDYQVSTLGNIRRGLNAKRHGGTFPGREKAKYPYRKPGEHYVTVYVCIGRRKTGSRGSQRRIVAQLVLETFVGPRPSRRYDASHIDGDSTNNQLYNLKWETKLVNQRRKLCSHVLPMPKPLPIDHADARGAVAVAFG